MKRQFYIGIAASIVCLSQLNNIDTSQAQLNCQDVADGCLKINTEAQQMFVEVSDVVDPFDTKKQVAEGSGLTGSSFPIPNKEVIRTVNDLWQLEVASGSENNFTANYQCNNLGSAIQLSIQPIPITVVGTGSAPDKSIIQGGAKFTFDLTNTKASGNYSCDLHIDVIEQQ